MTTNNESRGVHSVYFVRYQEVDNSDNCMAPSQEAIFCEQGQLGAQPVFILNEPNWTEHDQWVRDNSDLELDY